MRTYHSGWKTRIFNVKLSDRRETFLIDATRGQTKSWEYVVNPVSLKGRMSSKSWKINILGSVCFQKGSERYFSPDAVWVVVECSRMRSKHIFDRYGSKMLGIESSDQSKTFPHKNSCLGNFEDFEKWRSQLFTCHFLGNRAFIHLSRLVYVF